MAIDQAGSVQSWTLAVVASRTTRCYVARIEHLVLSKGFFFLNGIDDIRLDILFDGWIRLYQEFSRVNRLKNRYILKSRLEKFPKKTLTKIVLCFRSDFGMKNYII